MSMTHLFRLKLHEINHSLGMMLCRWRLLGQRSLKLRGEAPKPVFEGHLLFLWLQIVPINHTLANPHGIPEENGLPGPLCQAPC